MHGKEFGDDDFRGWQKRKRREKRRNRKEVSEERERKDIEKFSKYIQDKGYMSFIRRSRGDDVLAACGQLRTTSILTR